MPKGVSQVILVILLMMIGISLSSLTYLFTTGTISEIFPSQYFNSTYLRSRACLSLESVDFYNSNVTIKNCGLVPLSDFRLLIDLIEVPLSLDNLDPQETATAFYGWYLEGVHEFIVFADYAETPLIKLNASKDFDFAQVAIGNISLTLRISRDIILLMSSNPTTVLADNVSKSTITVRALDRDNNPLPNKIVSFATTLGYLDARTNRTDSNGYTTNRIKSDEPGTALIGAQMETSSNVTSVEFTILVGGEYNVTPYKCGDSVCKIGETCKYVWCDAIPPGWRCCKGESCKCY